METKSTTNSCKWLSPLVCSVEVTLESSEYHVQIVYAKSVKTEEEKKNESEERREPIHLASRIPCSFACSNTAHTLMIISYFTLVTSPHQSRWGMMHEDFTLLPMFATAQLCLHNFSFFSDTSVLDKREKWEEREKK